MGQTTALVAIVAACLVGHLNTTAGAHRESSQRLWYPRRVIQDEEAALSVSKAALIRGPSTSLRHSQSVGLRSPLVLSRVRWTPTNASYYTADGGLDLSRYDKRTSDSLRKQPYAYMMSPLSEQILEIGSSLDGDKFIDWPQVVASPIGRQVSSPAAKTSVNVGGDDECQTVNSVIAVTKDDVDESTGKLVRYCKGLVQVNKCEGSCGSFVQPSIKALTGLKRECSCCNEGAFRRIQARLTECYWTMDQRRILVDEDPQRSYMDIGLDEPIECKCRRCDSIV